MRYRVTSESDYGSLKVQLYNVEVPNEVANLAFAFLEKWGPVCAEMDGEDSAGRAKLRPLSPAETVTRAFDIAQAAYAEARKRGTLLDVPDLEEVNKAAEEERRAKARRKEAENYPAP